MSRSPRSAVRAGLGRTKRAIAKFVPASSATSALPGAIAQLNRNLVAINATLTKIDKRLATMDGHLTSMDKRLTSMDKRLTSMDKRLTSIDARVGKLERGVAGATAPVTKLHEESVAQRRILDVLRTHATYDLIAEVREFTDRQQLGLVETMERLATEELSFARFGDGEFQLMCIPDYRLRFQGNSPELMQDLRRVLTAPPPPGLMIGFPQVFRDVNGSRTWTAIWKDVGPLLVPDATYGNSHVSRPLMFEFLGVDRSLALWRKVWEGRHIAVITGEGSRFDLTPELFDNVASSTTISSTPVEAYADLDRLVEVTTGHPAELFLISLGPAGTLLAERLARAGRRAIDIGHLSSSLDAARGGVWPERAKLVTRPAPTAPTADPVG